MRNFTILILFGMLLGSLSKVSAQVEKKEEFSPAIEDNSFLIEEAYNQEERVVQHISNLMYVPQIPSSYFYTFTQEWPVGGQLNQLSYTIPLTFIRNGSSGLGDIMINYRYQLLGHDDWAAASPRLSLIFPTGSSEKGLGTGGYGLQVNLPFSKRLTEKFAAHFNLGATALFPKYTDADGNETRKLLPSYFWGGSLIWLTTSNFNFLFEYLNQINGSFDEKGGVAFENVHIINPGVRFAINLNRLQIVPGLSVPINIYKDNTYVDSFFYLSFEHPF
ncbi:MAG: transporter [Acidobacteriota bacterium]